MIQLRHCSTALLLLLFGCLHAPAQNAGVVHRLLEQDTVTILVTDSGLGGLSVAGDLEVKAERAGLFKHVSVVFCNALPDAQHGYNNVATLEEKAGVFSEALSGMAAAYHPDVILIACNTLSVVYPATQFSKESAIPVFGIVDLGVEMIATELGADTSASVIILGTETTIASGAHASLLRKKGVPAERILEEACPDLAGEIQVDSKSEAVKSMIELYAEDAASRLAGSRKGKIVAGLCCTHYGYCADEFVSAFKAAGINTVKIVNPNDRMADIVIPPGIAPRFDSTSVDVRVASRALLSPDELKSVGGLLAARYPRTAGALSRYSHRIDLFRFVGGQ